MGVGIRSDLVQAYQGHTGICVTVLDGIYSQFCCKQLHRAKLTSLLSVFQEFITTDIWEIMVATVNHHLAVGSSASGQLDPRRKPTSVIELQRFYGIHMSLENTFANDTRKMRKHFARMKKRYHASFPAIGWDRFSALMSAFAPSADDMKEIANLFHKSFMAHVDEGTVCIYI